MATVLVAPLFIHIGTTEELAFMAGHSGQRVFNLGLCNKPDTGLRARASKLCDEYDIAWRKLQLPCD